MTDFVLDQKGEEVISERHQKDFKKEYQTDAETDNTNTVENFTDIDFDDI
jgi:hypothetical protein